MKISTAVLGLTALVGAAVTVTTSDPRRASADAADASLFVDITTVQPNVTEPQQSGRASTGTFTVDCGRNENGHFNPDNFIAQPGVRNGAQHLHDYVGNLSTNADSTNESLEAAGTTCENGDKSAYFWPVLRIDTGEAESGGQTLDLQRPQAKQALGAAPAECPDVARGQSNPRDRAQGNDDQEIRDDEGRPARSAREGGTGAAGRDTRSRERTQGSGNQADRAEEAEDRPTRSARDGVANFGRVGRSPQRPRGGENRAECAQQDGNGNGNKAGAQPPQQLPGPDANNELPGNDGEIQRPETVELTFRGSAVGRVTAMPKFLRILYGDAKVSTNGPKNARDSFTCTGFEDRLIDKYPICPEGSKVKRVHDFPSCWDGRNIDSANHRDHIVFPGPDGRCRRGFKAVPQLRVTLTYNVPRAIQLAGQYKIDSFPEERHNPASDHDDFANVMPRKIMNRVVDCINKNLVCKE